MSKSDSLAVAFERFRGRAKPSNLFPSMRTPGNLTNQARMSLNGHMSRVATLITKILASLYRIGNSKGTG